MGIGSHRARRRAPFVFIVLLLAAAIRPARTEVVEEIVAWVNDDIITRSDFEHREQEAAQELYGKLAGEELDRKIAETRAGLLKDLISERLLTQRAERLYDMKKMRDSLLKNFKEQQKVATDQELEKLLKEEGMTLEDLRRRLVEYNAPRSVIQYEVRDKVSVGDAEVEAYYREHSSELAAPEQVTFREIVFLAEGRGAEKALDEANQAVVRLRAGEDFAKLAGEKSEAASRDRGGLLGPFRRGELNPEIEKVAFSLPVGQISDPIVTGHGAHVIRVESRAEARVPPLEEVREKITDRLEEERFRKNLTDYLQKLWAGADIEVARPYLDKISPDYKGFVKTAPEKLLR